MLLLFNSLPSRPVFFKTIGIREGLSQLSVHSIYQDTLGRMWFGTLEGLNIYDGKHITSYKNNRHLPRLHLQNNTVSAITGDKNGDVFYLIHRSLVRYDLKKDRFECIKEHVSALTGRQGEIYALANDSLFRWLPETGGMEFLTRLSFREEITRFFIASDNRLWVGTTGGLFLYDRNKDAATCMVPDIHVTALFESSAKNVWAGSMTHGMFRITPDCAVTTFRHNPAEKNSLSHNYVRTFEEDGQGNLWIGTFAGLNRYVPHTGAFTLYTKDYLTGSLSHSSVFALYKDKQGMMWVGTYYGGVNYFDCEKTPFTYYSCNPARTDCLNFPFVGHIAEAPDGRLYICTEGGGLDVLDKQTGRFVYHTAGSRPDALKHNNLKCICIDTLTDRVYIGTYTGGLSCYDPAARRFENYLDRAGNDSPRHANISRLGMFRGEPVVMDDYGLFRLDRKSGRLEPLLPYTHDSRYAGTDFIIDRRESLWLALTDHLLRIDLNNGAECDTIAYGKEKQAVALVTKLLEARDGTIYIATEGSGLLRFDRNTHTFTAYTAENNRLPSNYCYNVAESLSGNLIVTGDKGIALVHPEKGLLYTARMGKDFPFCAINNGCGLTVCRNGEILAGTTDGLLAFYEADLLAINDRYTLYFDGLYVNNSEIAPGDASGILTHIPACTDSLTLNHKQNNFLVTFACSNYANSSGSTYAYKLEGFDNDWISTEWQQINYTNLNPGKYLLRVREQESNRREPKEIRLHIRIEPPFYRTPLAWCLYLLTAATLMYAFLVVRQKQIRLRASLQYERKEKEYIRELNKAKLSFFTNISHEFRTPLTLIITQIEMILQHNALADAITGKLRRVYRNTFQLRNLINELLDFQKLEYRQSRLKVYPAGLAPFIREIWQLFEEEAERRRIRYTFTDDTNGALCWFDPEQLRKVFYNLLSNAFKFTGAGGLIEVTAARNGDDFVVRVIDNGIGIDKKDLDAIFEPYYQTSNSIAPNNRYFSTGLGLPLSKNIMQLHHGSITVESMLGYGSIFTVTLKGGNTHFAGDDQAEIVTDQAAGAILSHSLPEKTFMEKLLEQDNASLYEQTPSDRYTLLLAEDNEELLQVLVSLFSPLYTVWTAKDGEEGLRIARERRPDLIVSDVMMPKMDGMELCARLKNDLETCHIPVILLTAQSSEEKNIDGLLKGADDYITKPFHAKLLVTKCNNLIRNRLLQQQKYRQEPDTTIRLLADNELDRDFLKKVEEIIESRLDDPDFSVELLAKETALSRSSLFRKFKNLTGLTPNDFIRNYKLKRAAAWLKKHPELPVNDIAGRLGFSSPRYFSRCFKQEFNLSPQEYRKAGGN